MILQRDQAFRVLCSIRTPQGGQEECGTGMFINHNGILNIVTASHVVMSANAGTYFLVADDNGNSLSLSVADLARPGSSWRHHPDADIAALELELTQQNAPVLTSRFFPRDHVVDTADTPSRDAELTALGFPLGLGATGRFSPLSFRTYAASSRLTLPRFDTGSNCDFFILENPSIGGYSGGPVFDLGYMVVGAMTTTKEKTLCYGFMHGTISDNTGGKLAAVTPSSYLDGWL